MAQLCLITTLGMLALVWKTMDVFCTSVSMPGRGCILVQIIALPFCTLQVVYLVFANAVGACAAFFEGEKEEVNFHLGRLCKQLRLTRAMQKMHQHQGKPGCPLSRCLHLSLFSLAQQPWLRLFHFYGLYLRAIAKR